MLRYWETEFEQLRPQKNRAGNRIYTEKDIDIIKLIKRLTREDRYTIEGARQVLNQVGENGIEKLAAEGSGSVILQTAEEAVREALVSLRASLVALRSRLVETVIDHQEK